jgi:hypothetical protein
VYQSDGKVEYRAGFLRLCRAGDSYEEVAMRAPIILALSAALCGCTDSSIVHHNYYNSAYEPGHVMLAAANGPSLAVIRNDPFPQDRNGEGVLAAMQGRNLGPRMYFSQTPRPDDKYGYKVILDFAGRGGDAGYGSSGYGGIALTYGASYQCQASPAPASAAPPAAAPPSGDIVVSAAFCVGNLLLTDASASISGASGPDDPRFKRLIGDVMVALTPPYIPNGGHKCNMNC